jgi:hypothetical protein
LIMNARINILIVSAFLWAGCQTAEHGSAGGSNASNEALQADQNGSAAVRHVAGRVQASNNGVWQRLRAGQILRAGDEIRTGPDSSADLDLGPSGGVVRLTSATYVRLRRLSWHNEAGQAVADTLLEVPEGRVIGNSGKLAEQSLLKIQTPVSTTRIR